MKIKLLGLLLLPAMLASAQTLVEGKIFTSAEQRQYLDYLRKDFLEKSRQRNFNIEESQIPDIPDSTPNSPAAVVEFSFDAVMNRADGRLTIWLNHQPLTEQQLPKEFRLVHDRSTVALRVTASDGRTLLLRPGQTIDLNSGAIRENTHKPVAPAPKTTAAATPEPAADAAATAAKPAANGTTEAKPAATDTTSQNQQSAVESLPPDTLKDPNKLDAMIKSLEALKKGLDENRKQ